MALNEKQRLFVAEYLKDLNATAAYKRAGYSGEGHVAESAASRMLSNVEIAAEVQQAMDKRVEDLGIDARYVLKTIKNTIERCSQAVPVIGKDGKPVLVESELGDLVPAYTFESGAVLKGAELLGKHLKMFTDKTELTGKDGKDLIPPSDPQDTARRIAFLLAQAVNKEA